MYTKILSLVKSSEKKTLWFKQSWMPVFRCQRPEGYGNHTRPIWMVRVSVQFFWSPWENRNEAFTLGVYLILSCFISISLSTPKTFVLFWCWCWCGCGCWWRTFFVFESLENNTVYSLNTGVYIHIYIFVQNKFLVDLIFSSSWKNFQLFSKSHC